MANITNYLNKIKTAVYGKDVRGAIHDAIKQVYDDASVNHDNANMEVKMARGTHNTLNDRLDNVDEIQAQTNAQLSDTKKELKYYVTPEDFGAKGDGFTDDTDAFYQMFSTGKKIVFTKEATYLVGNITKKENVQVESEYLVTLKLFKKYNENPVLLGIGSNSQWKNVRFVSTEEDLEWNRTDISNVNDVILNKCHFEGFRHRSDRPNAWGIYLENSKNISIKNCTFEDNSQSDIAIVDGCDNIAIENCGGSDFCINIEPNGTSSMQNISVSDCKIKNFFSLENSFTKILIQSVLINNCDIENFHYRGGNVKFNRVNVSNYHSDGNYFLGGFNNDSLILSKNLLDNKIVDLDNSSSGGTSWYVGYTPATNNIRRIDDDFGRCIVLNPRKAKTVVELITEIDVTPNSTYYLQMTTSSEYGEGASWLANHGTISGYGSNGDQVFTNYLICNQSTANNVTNPSTKSCFISVPCNVVKLKIQLCNTRPDSTSPTLLKIYDIKLSKVFVGSGNQTINDDKNYVSKCPVSINAVGLNNNIHLAGEIVYMKTPVAGDYIGYVCVESGNPGSWRGFGVIQS